MSKKLTVLFLILLAGFLSTACMGSFAGTDLNLNYARRFEKDHGNNYDRKFADAKNTIGGGVTLLFRTGGKAIQE